MCLLLSALAWGGCQAGPIKTEAPPPPLRLVASEPSAGEGTDCTQSAPADCGVQIGSSITLRFDRYLRASSAVRQSIRVYTGDPSNGVGLLRPEYDVVERVVVYRITQFLEPGALYTVEVLSSDDPSGFGFQAYDGAPLEEGAAPLKFNFFTQRNRDWLPQLPLEPIPSCQRILDIFSNAGCTAGGCHGGSIPSAGLLLDRPESFAKTALNRAARQTEIGAQVGVPLQDPVRFGVQMPIVDPGQPANSYLMYKLLRGEFSHWLTPHDPGSCSSRYSVALGPDCVPPPAAELTRLREWFVRGAAMPPPSATPRPPFGAEPDGSAGAAGSAGAEGSAGADGSAGAGGSAGETGPSGVVLRPELREIQRFIAGGALCQ